jgi:excisionase family DNA binding protein
MERQTLSIMKACEVVGVSRRTIYNWISAGKVEYVRTAGGAIRIFADSLWREPGDTQNTQARSTQSSDAKATDARVRGITTGTHA